MVPRKLVRRRFNMVHQGKIPFLITIDTEGDNLWSRPQVITTRNAQGLPRFQRLCNQFGFKPTYLTNYEMALDQEFVRFARTSAAINHCEIGMHLHAWNSPPLVPLTEADFKHQPYLIDYPDDSMRDKINYLHSFLQEVFETRIVSHRAGRWAMNETYMQHLEDLGYLVDCSVTPGIAWPSSHAGAGYNGCDYSRFPAHPYHPCSHDMSKSGDMQILELPVTIINNPNTGYRLIRALTGVIGGKRLNNMLNTRQHLWIRPRKHNLRQMIQAVQCKLAEQKPFYIQFMLHSSELMAGTNPQFVGQGDIERLYRDLETFFTFMATVGMGMTLHEYYRTYTGDYSDDAGLGV